MEVREYQMRTTGKYELPHKKMRHPEEVFDALGAFSRDQRFREQYESVADKKEAADMPIDSWFDQVVPEAEARGEERVKRLYAALEKADRVQDFGVAMKDRQFLHRLYKEFNIDVGRAFPKAEDD